jgi:hypothetical protein
MTDRKKITGKWHGKRYDYEDLENNTVQLLIKNLKYLNKQYNITGIKQSFEDEGALLSDVTTMRRVTELCGMLMYVKIGGCEAITDINNCVTLGIDSLIAPMIETKYSFQKFINAVSKIKETSFYFLCETETAYSNIDSILESEEAKKLSGVIVGRSDFTKSHNLDKSEVDSQIISDKVEDIFRKSKNLGLKTTMGGNISTNSVEFIKYLHSNNLLDKIETRNVVVELDDYNVNNLYDTIKSILRYEIQWLRYKAINYNSIGDSYLHRADILKERL